MRKYCLSLISLLLLLISTGCSGYKDIDNRFFVVGFGIDLTENEENPYLLTVSLAVPSSKIEPGSSFTQIETIETPSIAEGLRQLKSQVDKELDFAHCNIIVLGEKLANDNIREAAYWMARRRDVQNIAAIGVGRPTANKIISNQPKSDRFPGDALSSFFTGDATESSYTYRSQLTVLFRRINEPGVDPVLPIITVGEDNTFTVNTVAMLDKKKIKLVLEPRETQLFNQISEHLAEHNVYGSFHKDQYTVVINTSNSKFKFVQKEDNNKELKVNIKQLVSFEQLPSENSTKSRNYEEIIKQLEKAYNEESVELLNKIKEASVDPIGFGLRYRANNKLTNEQFYETWPSVYEQLTFDVQTTMNLRGTGLLR